MKKNSLAVGLLSVVMTAMLALTGCSTNHTAESNNTIYATIAPVYDFTRKIAGDKFRIELLVKGDIHDYEPSAAEMAKMEKAKMIVYNGMSLDSFVNNISDNNNIPLVNTSTNTTVVENAADHSHDHEEHYVGDGHDHTGETLEHYVGDGHDHVQHSADDGHDHSNDANHYVGDGHDHNSDSTDPHIWLYPMNAKLQLANIRDALVKADSANADYYNANYDTYAKKCDELDTKFKTLKGKTIVTTHNAYGYWHDVYGIEVMAMDTAGAEISPAKMKEIIDYCKKNNITTIYYEEGGSDKNAQAVAKEIGGSVKALNSFESVVNGKDDYFTIMEENYEALK